MDALEVMDNLTNIYPKFQPMYHAGNHEIAGFEVTSHFLDSEGVEHHLSAFIYDNQVPEEYRRQVDMQTRTAAFQIMQDENVFLYISINASLYTGSEADNLLEEFKNTGVPAILGVVCTDDFSGWEEIKHFTYYLQRSGLKVAMKSLAYQQLTLRDLSHIKPDVVEMDMQSFQTDLVDLHRELFHSYSVAAGKIGASLLFRGIGNFQQLKDAWQSGARYIQGDFLSTTKRDVVHDVGSKARLQKEFQRFLTYEQERIRSLLTFTSDLGKRMEKIVSSQSIEALDAFAYEIGKRMDDVCFRVYIVNDQGEQQTANMVRTSAGVWEYDETNRWQNWSWRPYFLENIVRMNVSGKGVLSDLYKDLTTTDHIRTFSYPMNEQLYVFMDIGFSFLYEHPYLSV